MIIKCFLSFFIAFLLATYCYAQNQAEIDSLETELKKDLTDSARVDILNALATQFNPSDVQKALAYVNNVEQLALKINYKKGLATAYHEKSILLKLNGQPGQAMEYHMKEMRLNNQEPPLLTGLKKIRNNSANDTSVLKSGPQDEKGQILRMLIQSLRKSNRDKKDSSESEDLKIIAEANEMLGNYEEALKYHQMYEQVKDSLNEAEQQSLLAQRNAELKNEELQLETLKVHAANVQRIFLISGIVVLLILSIITYSRFVVKKRSNEKLELAYHDLRDTQQQLIRQEKLASLGQLTAGIAHEIKNPLNFVNNFSESSEEILDELKVAASEEERSELIGELKKNLSKISHHGKRADSIVTNMLNHSRTSSGEKQLTDINELCDEFFILAYHGMKANYPDFNCKLEKDLSPNTLKAEVVTQDVSRVLLNLFNNAFYAVHEKAKVDGDYQPVVSLHTESYDHTISISVRDNGKGIPHDIKEKIFEPFFTTKPAGQGTGLGLSLSYDIVKAHGGEIKVESKENNFTEFTILLPQ